MVLQVLETILCIGTSNKQVKILIQQIQNSVQQRKWPCFIRYIRVHLHLPGSLVEGNALDHKFPKTKSIYLRLILLSNHMLCIFKIMEVKENNLD